ncbi:MAG: polysaccharide pyruvyl transferase family protein [Bacteroidales bacterium]|nr:polysaccharide pyruvyl transferase family protein [Bacteroidales bacterium]
MKKIIYYKGLSVDCDIYTPTNYEQFYSEYTGKGKGNVGNKLFVQAAEKYITNDYTSHTYVYYDETNFKPFANDDNIDNLNENYDLVIMPQANIFCNSDTHRNLLKMWTNGIKQFKIPVFVLGVGIQMDSISELHTLINSIKREAVDFIESVLVTGGNISLRGYQTKMFFDALGFPNTVVTGCPSMFQKGRNIHITTQKIKETEFKPVINGHLGLFYKPSFANIFSHYKNAVYLDQDQTSSVLYNPEFFEQIKHDKDIFSKIPYKALKLIAEKRLFLFYDIQAIFNYLTQNRINFSYGSRIHGNIMALLNGIPSFVYVIDSRTEELADYFNIPHSRKIHSSNIYEEYLKCDYEKFNSVFPKLFDKFEKYLMENHIIENKLDDFSLFDKKIENTIWQTPAIINQSKIDNLVGRLRTHNIWNNVYDYLRAYTKQILRYF